MTWQRILASLAGLMGAAGVALSAVAAHKVQSPALATAAQMLLIHAVAVLALMAMAAGARRPRVWMVAAGVIATGSILFASALVAPALAGVTLFAMAAPTGGSTMIAGWLAVSIAGILELRVAKK